MEELENIQKIEAVKKKLNEIMELDAVGDFLKSNEFEFEFKGNKYRVRKPSYKAKQEAYQKRLSKYSTLLKEKNEDGTFKYSIEEDLLREYKARGIDIDAMNKQIDNLVLDKERLMMRLGKGLTDKAPENDLNIYRKEIEKTNQLIQQVANKKAKLLEFSIENQVLLYFYSYLTYLMAEQYVKGKDLGEGNKEPDEWKRVWNSFDEYENADEELILEFSYRAVFLINGIS